MNQILETSLIDCDPSGARSGYLSVNSPAPELTARVKPKGMVKVRVRVRVTVSVSVSLNKNNLGAG